MNDERAMLDIEKRPPARRPSRVEKALIRWLTRSAKVAAVRQLSTGFRLIDLEGPALRNARWTPGDKIQVMLVGLLTARTYTPITWDGERGHIRILAWSHGPGPGSDWARSLAPGDALELFGPRRSIEIERPGRPRLVFGDESSFGLMLSLAAAPGSAAVHGLFEVSSAGECAPVAAELGLAADLVERIADDSHLREIEQRSVEFVKRDFDFVLTGRALAIQRMSRALKSLGVASSRIRTKAYWAPGKKGLD